MGGKGSGRRSKKINVRGGLYKMARVMGDLNAINKRRVSARIGRRVSGKLIGGILRRLF